MTITLLVSVKGGSGSGNWGHAGRPGLVGGSGGTGGGAIIEESSIADWYHPLRIDDALVGKLEELGPWDAAEAAEELGLGVDWYAYEKTVRGWTQAADTNAKYDIESWIVNRPHIRTLALYGDYSSDAMALHLQGKEYPTFKDWLDVPQTVYRGGGRSDVFMSFAKSPRVAHDASGGESIWAVTTTPRHWFAAAGTGAGEIWVETDAITHIPVSYTHLTLPTILLV